jgi:UrcA family protein
VQYADLDIASPSGARVLYGRIRAAARSACAYYWFKTDADEARCLRNTIAKAVSEIDQPALSALYDSQYKTSALRPLVSQEH